MKMQVSEKKIDAESYEMSSTMHKQHDFILGDKRGVESFSEFLLLHGWKQKFPGYVSEPFQEYGTKGIIWKMIPTL